jgi:hypothetical protein
MLRLQTQLGDSSGALCYGRVLWTVDLRKNAESEANSALGSVIGDPPVAPIGPSVKCKYNCRPEQSVARPGGPNTSPSVNSGQPATCKRGVFAPGGPIPMAKGAVDPGVPVACQVLAISRHIQAVSIPTDVPYRNLSFLTGAPNP